jgi:Fe(3+) dicitrate transport protein
MRQPTFILRPLGPISPVKFLRPLRTVLAVLLCGGAALQAVPDAHEREAYELAPVEVIGEEAEALFRLPGSGYRVDGTVIEAFQLDDVHRLLQRVPGVYFREEDGYGQIANLSLRGVDTSRSAKLTLMEDGVPTAPAPYSAPAAYYTPTLGRMSTVEVLKGTSQVRYGPHTTGGVVNYLSTPLPGRRAGSLRLSVGSDSEVQALGWLGERWALESGELDALVEGYHRDNDGFRRIAAGGSYPGSGDTGLERSEAMVKLGWTSADRRHRLEFKAGMTDLEANFSYLGLSDADFRADPYQRYAASREDVLSSEHERSYLRYGYRISDTWTLSLTGYYNTFHRNWYKLNDILDLDTDGDGVVEGASGGQRVALGLSQAVAGDLGGAGLEALKGARAASFRVRANNRDYYLAGTEMVLRGSLDNGTWQHNPLLGIRYHEDRIRRLQWHDRFDQAADGGWGAPVKSPLGSDGNRRQHTASTALFIEDEMVNGPWIVRPGLRLELLDLTYADFTTDGSNQRVIEESRSMDVWSAGIATTYLLQENRAVFFNLYRGFSVPGPRAAIRGDIDEETSLSGELGFRYRSPQGSLTFEAVAFRTRYEDLIVIDNIGSGTSGTGNSQQPVTENVGNVDSHGLELLARGDLHQSADGAWTVPVSLAFTWTVAELDGASRSTDAESIFSGGRDGSRLPYIPEFSLNLSIGLQSAHWSTGLSVSWRDATYSTATESGGMVNPVTGRPDARYGRIDSVFLVDWNIRYRVNERLSLFASVNNLLDEVHLVSRHPHGARAGAPRQLGAGIHLSY